MTKITIQVEEDHSVSIDTDVKGLRLEFIRWVIEQAHELVSDQIQQRLLQQAQIPMPTLSDFIKERRI